MCVFGEGGEGRVDSSAELPGRGCGHRDACRIGTIKAVSLPHCTFEVSLASESESEESREGKADVS